MSGLRPSWRVALAATLAVLLGGCSIRKTAVNKFGDALAGSSANFAGDDDLELIGDAIPFGLKTMEGLLEEAPRHRGLLLACTSGFVQYAYGWVQTEADIVEAKDLQRATEMRARAQKLYLRAREYGLRGLELDAPTLRADLQRDPRAALARMKAKDVPQLYFTTLAWAGAISLKVNDSELSADQKVVEALARRALELEPCFNLGSIHEFFVSWESARSSIGGSLDRAREHYEADLACAQGRRAFPYVVFAENVSVAKQDKAQFKELMEKALAFDVSQKNAERVANLLAQKRARFQLGRIDELFIE
jgi:predicted anti-sigma-YlaC factor YlaD